MNDTIAKLTSFLPEFETGEPITYKNWFMDFHKIVMDDFLDENYPEHLEKMGWDCLTDIDYIGRADIDQLRTILTAIIRSERHSMGGEPWEAYVKAGCFPAILKRLGELHELT